MSAESEERTGHGIGGGYGWPIGGILGGLVGTAAFGLLLWLLDPEILRTTIPELYGIQAGGMTGWLAHLALGAVLGLVFGFLVTREVVLGVLLADLETPALSGTGATLRFVGAGLAFGLAVWALLPVFAIPMQIGVVERGAADAFPTFAVEGLAGHAIFGALLGAMFAAVVDVTARSPGTPFEE